MSKSKLSRADAIRNRDRLIEVSRKLFSTRNGAVTLEEIAQLAGVGIGTLYRHFPTREALVEAVYSSELDALATEAEDLLYAHKAFDALRMWMDRYALFVATKRAMYDALRIALTSRTTPIPEVRARIRTSVARFLSAGASDGTIRDDIAADDLTVNIAALVLAATTLSDRDQLRRLMDLLMDGLRPCH